LSSQFSTFLQSLSGFIRIAGPQLDQHWRHGAPGGPTILGQQILFPCGFWIQKTSVARGQLTGAGIDPLVHCSIESLKVVEQFSFNESME
jgi:hypothetical protein